MIGSQNISAISRVESASMVEVDSIQKIYPSAVRGDLRVILSSVSFSAPQGQFLSVVGPSGCGKTTMLRMLGGLTLPDAGEIRVGGVPLTGPSAEVGFVFQKYSLLPWRTVLQNLEFALELRHVPKAIRRARAMEVLDMLGLRGFEGYMPAQLSGGMQQRVGLGRALTKRPQLLLMDEPFAALDFHTRERLQRELAITWEHLNTTVVFVTHNIEEAIYLGDRVIVMAANPGRIVGDVDIDLPRPRSDPDVRRMGKFAELGGTIRDLLAANATSGVE